MIKPVSHPERVAMMGAEDQIGTSIVRPHDHARAGRIIAVPEFSEEGSPGGRPRRP
jgi:hypothetical protein